MSCCAVTKPAPLEGQPPKVLYRATVGKDDISTHVSADDMGRFTSQYSALLRACTPNLKKTKKVSKKGKKADNGKAAAGAGRPASTS
jgi:hypothetical protein